jgi:hypothetical protein
LHAFDPRSGIGSLSRGICDGAWSLVGTGICLGVLVLNEGLPLLRASTESHNERRKEKGQTIAFHSTLRSSKRVAHSHGDQATILIDVPHRYRSIVSESTIFIA